MRNESLEPIKQLITNIEKDFIVSDATKQKLEEIWCLIGEVSPFFPSRFIFLVIINPQGSQLFCSFKSVDT
ncbi:MAG: hypothetical protein MUO82_06790 [Candidatus Thermoplasmatota archaeon]|nr:hypothetical protein [Candidatus Thermoplasmatota archaeon]